MRRAVAAVGEDGGDSADDDVVSGELEELRKELREEVEEEAAGWRALQGVMGVGGVDGSGADGVNNVRCSRRMDACGGWRWSEWEVGMNYFGGTGWCEQAQVISAQGSIHLHQLSLKIDLSQARSTVRIHSRPSPAPMGTLWWCPKHNMSLL